MVIALCAPLRRWWQSAFATRGPSAVPALAFRSPAVRARVVRGGATTPRPLTPFRAGSGTRSAVDGARRAARQFWMTLDPDDRRRGAIGGSFAEVCDALERLAALEERSTPGAAATRMR
jgi:hypothetical protein